MLSYGFFPDWTWIVGAWIGATVGSFLNVVIYRLPRGLSIGQPKWSFCPKCEARLRLPDLIPLFSWIFLKGKCRHCAAPIGPRYFIVELITGSLFGMVWYQHFVVGGGSAAYETTMVVGYSLLAAALVAAIFTDLAHYIIPDQINAFMLAVGIAMNIALIVMNHPAAWQWGMPSSVAGALVGIGVIWGIAFLGRLAFGKDAMGHGDIKMARGIGAVILPAAALMSFALAVVMGALMGIVIIIARRRDTSEEAEEDAENYEEPESIGSLLKCGLGYVLCIDVIGLFVPKLYEAWFEENPYAVEEIEDDPEVSLSMIPFGPYLAAGALGAMLFNEPLQKLIDAYLNSVGPS